MKKFSDARNGTRAEWASIGLAAYLEAKGEDDDDRSNIIDLITDLLHLAHRDCIKVDGILDGAKIHYNVEA